jgi:hypothetical protein
LILLHASPIPMSEYADGCCSRKCGGGRGCFDFGQYKHRNTILPYRATAATCTHEKYFARTLPVTACESCQPDASKSGVGGGRILDIGGAHLKCVTQPPMRRRAHHAGLARPSPWRGTRSLWRVCFRPLGMPKRSCKNGATLNQHAIFNQATARNTWRTVRAYPILSPFA